MPAYPPEIPAELAIQGFQEVRAYTNHPEASRELLEGALEFERAGGMTWEARGENRGGRYVYDPAPAERGIPGAGTVHHVAWASLDDQQVAWRGRGVAARPQPRAGDG